MGRMVELTTALGVTEVVGAVVVVALTLTVGAFREAAVAWRVLAVFMAAEGLNRLR